MLCDNGQVTFTVENADLPDDYVSDILADLTEDDGETSAVQRPRKTTKRAEGRSGRSAFVDPVCTYHPDWEFDDGTIVVADGDQIHCAKFGHLPGRGRGVYQPGILRVLLTTTLELIKPLLVMGLLLGGIFVLKTTLLGGGFLRPSSHVCKTTGTVSASSRPTPAVSPTSTARPTHSRPSGTPHVLPSSKSVTKKC